MVSEDLLHRFGLLVASPAGSDGAPGALQALEDRITAEGAATLADLTDADRAWLRTGALQVSAGLSQTFTDPSDFGDFAAIDAAVDAGDDDALDVALGTVGRGPTVAAIMDGPGDPVTIPDDEVDIDEPDDEPKAPEAKAADFGDDWIGL